MDPKISNQAKKLAKIVKFRGYIYHNAILQTDRAYTGTYRYIYLTFKKKHPIF